MKLSSLSVTLLASLANVQGATPFGNDKKEKKGMRKQEGQTLLDSGNYILCKVREAFSFNKFSTFFPGPDDEPTPLLEEVSLEVNVLGDGLYSAVFTRTVPCNLVGLNEDCPDSPVDTKTLVKYYFVGSQSYVPSKKNEISFASDYAEYQVNVNGDFDPLDKVGDKEVSFMDVVVEGKQVFADISIFLDAGSLGKVALSNARVFAKEEDGCPE